MLINGYTQAVQSHLPSFRIVLYSLLMACAGGGASKLDPATEEVEEESPWSLLEPTPLDSARLLLSPQIGDGVAPVELSVLPDRALVFVLDSQADRVHILDARYGHDGRAFCINESEVSDSKVKGRVARCADGTTEVQRGALIPRDRPVALAVDPVRRTAVILTRGGTLFRVQADVLSSSFADYLALDEGQIIEDLGFPVEEAQIAAFDGRIAIASQGRLITIDGDDVQTSGLPDVAIDIGMNDKGLLVLTKSSVWTDRGMVDVTGQSLVWWQEGWWLAQPDSGHVLNLDDGTSHLVEDITGPVTVDSRNDVLQLATSTGFVRLDPTGSQDSVALSEPVLDLGMNRSGELVVLHPEGAMSVIVDETAYAPDTPLDVFITTFVERPSSASDHVPCEASESTESIETFLDRAEINRQMLRDLPAPIALGLTPAMVNRAAACRSDGRLATLVDQPRTSVGILVHEEPAGCLDDRSCHVRALEAMQAGFTGVLSPEWVSGMAPHHELGINWVDSIERAGLPSRYLFFGLSIHPGVAHESDLTAKEAWPITLGDMGRAWSTDSSAAVAERGGTGWLAVYPGNEVAAFSLGGCASLLIRECRGLMRGGGTTLDAQDVVLLDLLLHRAITQSVSAEVRTWSFHLPDIGSFDYTEGCEQDDRIWSGENCPAAMLQTWLIDVDRRLVDAGLVRWTLPGNLERP